MTLKGQEGLQKIQEMMERIRKEVPEQIGGLSVTQFRDYREDILLDCVTKERRTTGLPKSNVLYFELEKDAWCCVRPSGTEPKIKFYVGVRGNDEKEAEEALAVLTEGVKNLV